MAPHTKVSKRIRTGSLRTHTEISDPRSARLRAFLMVARLSPLSLSASEASYRQVKKPDLFFHICTGTIWSRGLFGFAFIAPRIGTLQLLQLYETDANNVTMAMIIFTPVPDVSMSRNRVRPASSSFVFGLM